MTVSASGVPATVVLASQMVPVVPDGLTVTVASGFGRAAPVEPLLPSWTRK